MLVLQVRLLSPLNFTLVPHIRPVCLPLAPATTHAGQLATVTGWGSLYSFGPSPTTLQVNTEQQHDVSVIYTLSRTGCTDQLSTSSISMGRR